MFSQQIKEFYENILDIRTISILYDPKILTKLESQVDNDILKQIATPIVESFQNEFYNNQGALENFSNSYQLNDNSIISSSHTNFIYTSLLISLISSSEWFFAQILHRYYDKYPKAAGIEEKTLTLADLKLFKNIEEAEKSLIADKVDEILRNGFEKWIDILAKKPFNLKLECITSIQDELIEIYQRRNLIVHNRGVVNSVYLTKVREDYRKNIQLNTKINIDKNYIDNAISKIQLAFILIATELWQKLEPKNNIRGEIIARIAYDDYMLKNKWVEVEKITTFLIKDKNLEQTIRIIAQLNYWLSQKRLGKFEAIKHEIQRADFSAYKEWIQLGFAALKEDKKTFFKLLPIAIEANSDPLPIEKLEEFPIFEEMRATPEYDKFKLESPHFKPKNTIN